MYNARSPSLAFAKDAGKDWKVDRKNADDCHEHHVRSPDRHEWLLKVRRWNGLAYPFVLRISICTS